MAARRLADLPAGVWARVWRRVDRHALISLALLAALLVITSTGVNTLTKRSADIMLPLMALLGAAFGWHLAGAQISWRRVTFLSIPAGLLLAILHAGQLWAESGALLQSAGSLTWEMLHWQPGSPPPDTSIVTGLGADLLVRVQQLLNASWSWAAGLARGRAVFDLRAAKLVWGGLMWCAAIWATWWVRRRANPLAAGLPAMMLFALSAAYTRSPAGGIAAALVALFALIAWNQFTGRQNSWQNTAMDTAEDLAFDLGMWATIVCLGMVGLGLAAAQPSPQQAFRAARALLLDRGPVVTELGEALGLQSKPQPGAGNAATGLAGVMPRQHLLAGGVEVNRNVAMLVQTSPLPFAATLPYLRAASYDVYTGQGWITAATEKISYPAGQMLPHLGAPGQEMEFAVQMIDASKMQIYTPGELMHVDQPVRVDWRSLGEFPDAFGARLQVSGQSSEQAGQPGEPRHYRASAWVSPVGENELRQAGTVYPEEIQRRYLQLPDRLPERVRNLAGSLVQGEDTPYDRARRIEAYLRAYRYSLDLPTPPPNRDLVDFFLFDLRAGYCDYNASAMVVLARATGIPARLAIGYALPQTESAAPAGDNQPAGSSTIVVTEDLAHSWPELYFPGWGWVTFEPTGGREGRTLPETRPTLVLPAALPPDAFPAQTLTPPAARWPAYVFGSFVILVLLFYAWMRFGRRQVHGQTELTRMYAELRRESNRLGVRLYPGQTPLELSAALNERILSLAGPRRLMRWIAPAGEQARRLIALYTRAQYSQSAHSLDDLSAIRQAWGLLRLRLWLARLPKIFEQNRKTHAE